MAKLIERLSPGFVTNTSTPGRYPDGGGLYLVVSEAGSKSWLFTYRFGARRPEMGLGSVHDVSLKAARVQAQKFREIKKLGGDPLAQRRTEQAAKRAEQAKAINFKTATVAYIEAKRPGWKPGKASDQWENGLTSYCYPIFGDVSIGDVSTEHVLRALSPIWAKKHPTAKKLRGKIELILDWAKALGYRTGENAARWRGHLSNLLPKRPRKSAIKHFAAVPYSELPTLFSRLRQENGVASLALQFVTLTCVRTTEALHARWSEVNWDDAIWEVPAERMKGAAQHRVPLTRQALDILRRLYLSRSDGENDGWIFPGRRKGRPLSNMACLMVLRRLRDNDGATVHGMRSAFHDFADNETAAKDAVIEACLAHVISDDVIAAYRRSEFLKLRRGLMETWASHCHSKPSAKAGNVVPLRRGVAE